MTAWHFADSSSEQSRRARKLFAAVVLAALDDAINDEKTYGPGKGAEGIARWANSRDGIEVLTNAGIEVNSRTIDGLVAFVKRGVRVSNALSLKEDTPHTSDESWFDEPYRVGN